MSSLQIELLGPPRVTVDGSPLQVDTRKAIALLAMIAVDGSQPRETLARLLWPDSETTRARGALRRTLSVLSKALGGRWLVTDRRTVSLDASGADCDVTEAARLIAGIHTHDESDQPCAVCVDELRRAVALHRGAFLEGFALRDSAEFDDWRAEREEHLRRRLCRALDRLTRAEVAAADLDQALVHLEHWLRADPLNERVHGKLMLVHAWRGERTEAIQRYRTCVSVLDRELGVTPLPRTTSLYRAVVEGRVGPPPGAPGVPADEATALVGSAGDDPDPPRPAPHEDAHDSGPGHWPVVGRDRQLDLLLTWHRAGRGGLTLVTGEAGIGKSRLVDELVGRLRDTGTRVAQARCYVGEVSLAFGPVVDLLRVAVAEAPLRVLEALPSRTLAEVARLVPDLLESALPLPEPPPLDSPGAQALLFESVWEVLAATLAGTTPGVLVIDELQAVDSASLELLGYGIRRLTDRRLDVVACLRREDAPEPLNALLDDPAVAADLRTVTLERLARDDVAELVATAVPGGDGDGLADRLHHESEGLPLLLVEYLRLLTEGTADPTDPGGWTLPHGAHELARSRLATVSETGRQVASAAAAVGRSFDLEVVRHASGRADDELVDGLEELLARRLVRELPADGGAVRFDFVHDKLRAAIYDDTSLARRRLLHGRIADVLAMPRHGQDVGALAGVIGEHAQLAGRDDEAAQWFFRAGEHARSLFAHHEALAHLERALALGHPEAWRVHAMLGELRVLAGEYSAAVTALEAAAAQAGNDRQLAWTEHRLGALHLRRGDFESAAAHLEAAAGLASEEPGLTARIGADQGLLRLRLGDLDQAALYAQRARDLADTIDDVEAQAQALNLLGVVARHRGDHAEARYHLGRGAAWAETLEDPSAHVAALNNLALATADAGDLAAAIELQQLAVERGALRGDRHREAALRNNLADLLHLAGREDESMAALAEAVALFATIDAHDRPSPEIWKLVDW